MVVHYSGIMLHSSKTNVTNFLSKTSQNRIILHAKKKNIYISVNAVKKVH